MAPPVLLFAVPALHCGLLRRKPRRERRATAMPPPAAVHSPFPAHAPGPPGLGQRDDDPPITLLGCTGGTGASAVAGMVWAGVAPQRLRVVTRDPSSARARALAATFEGLQLVRGDADDDASLDEALQGAQAVYVHALAGDSGKAEPREAERAARLAAALARAHYRSQPPSHIVFNSAAGVQRTRKPPAQMAQKAAVEAIFRDPSFGLRHTFIRPAMFMEEWWKSYTRPGVLNGKLALALPRELPLQLTSVRDVGVAAALALAQPDRYAGAAFDLAGDELTPAAMADAFAAAQRAPVRVLSLPAWPLALLRPTLHDVVRFLRDAGYGVNVAECRRQHPYLLSFSDFLALTRWGDPERSYDSSILYDDAEVVMAQRRARAQKPAAQAQAADGA